MCVFPFVLGLALFAIGLAVAGAAVSMPMLIAARLIQGIGGGAIPPIAYVAIGRSLPEHLRPRMFATLSTAWILPGILGPGIAGVVAEAFSWRWIFLGLLPLLAVSGSMAYRGLRGPRGGRRPRRAAGSSRRDAHPRRAGRGASAWRCSRPASPSSDPLLVFGLGGVGAGDHGLGVPRLVPPGTLRAARGYPTAVLLRGILTFAFFAVDVYVALLLVEVRGWSAAAAGIALTAATVSWTAGSWTQARLSARLPARAVRADRLPGGRAGLAGLGLILHPGGARPGSPCRSSPSAASGWASPMPSSR